MATLVPPMLRPASEKNDGDNDNDNDSGVVLEREPKSAKARRYCVIFYNDDYTTKWFVVYVLEQFFHMEETMAMGFMLAVHQNGRGVAGVYTRDIAETKAKAVMDSAKEHQMPLMVTAEPEELDDDS
jgi:ATP-dependent Clp protease adaptor protein ClpS